ncbi:MAG TPA: M48 family metallopeptidase [Flavitalea sp.]|nr:M48 family metallopeptidase [Flavitalea sp.]
MTRSFQNLTTTKITIFLGCLLILSITSYTQAIFSPAAENESLLQTLAKKYETAYKNRVSSLPSSNRKDFEDIYTLRWKLIRAKFDEKEIYTSPAAQQYLDALVQDIVTSNIILSNKSFFCFFSRSGTPNASFLGEGIILFNMGLFKRLENESQAAFVLCHELAHFYLEHSDKRIKKYVTSINSPEMQKELRKIKNTEYGKREQFEKLAKGFAFNTRRHGRENENEADSLAVEFMKTTRFDPSQAISTLALLDKIDIDTLDILPVLQKTFHAKDYPFQKKWVAVENGLLGGHATVETEQSFIDSLKTHPDCKIRMKTLENILSRSRAPGVVPKSNENHGFRELQKKFSYEIVEYAFSSGNYTRSLFYTLELLEKHPGDPYLITQVGKIFNGFFESQKYHTLGKVTELPSPYHPTNYNLLLQFIQNLYREDYASISYHYLKQFHPLLDHYAPFKNVYSTSIQIAQR